MLMGGGETTVVAEVQAVVDSQAHGKPPNKPERGSAAYPPAFRLSPSHPSAIPPSSFPLPSPYFVLKTTCAAVRIARLRLPY
jgi:hypothetical protein